MAACALLRRCSLCGGVPSLSWSSAVRVLLVLLDRRALRVLGVANPPQVLQKVVLVQQVVPHFQEVVLGLRLVPQFPGG